MRKWTKINPQCRRQKKVPGLQPSAMCISCINSQVSDPYLDFKSRSRKWYQKELYLKQSVSQWNAWPAMGRSALQDLRSCAILQASLALSPVSSSISCTHVRQGRPCWRFHSGLMSGLPPVPVCRKTADWQKVACDLSNVVIFSDLQWLLTHQGQRIGPDRRPQRQTV